MTEDQKRPAWERFAAAAMASPEQPDTGKDDAEVSIYLLNRWAAERADRMLVEELKRFGTAGDSETPETER